MAREIMPPVKGYSPYEALEPVASIWPFSIEGYDAARMDRWLGEGFGDKDLVLLGPPQAVDLGVRALAPIVEMAETLERMREKGLGMPRPLIFCPSHINAYAEDVPVEGNLQMAAYYGELANQCFAQFHPNLPLPLVITDQPEGVEEISRWAPQVSQSLSPEAMNELSAMARKHHEGNDGDQLRERAVGYFLAHYIAYGWLENPNYVQFDRKHLFLVPNSETKFTDLMAAEAENIPIKGIRPPDESEQGVAVTAYLDNNLSSPHYYRHNGEPSLVASANRWPTWNSLCQTRGFNGYAREETWRAIELIEQDIGGNIKVLQNILREVNTKYDFAV